MINKTIKGVVPILTTAFKDDGTLDLESTRNLVKMYLEAGVDGMALFGNASEAYTLTVDEREELASMVTEELGGKLPLVFGAGGAGIFPAIESIKLAENQGADALMIMPPTFVKPNPQKAYEFYSEVAKATDLSIMIQDAQLFSGVSLPVDIIIKLVNENDNIKYIKSETPPTFIKMQKIKEALGDKVNIFGGINGIYLYEELESGSIGTMPAGEFPGAFVKILRAYESGDKKTAKELFYKYLPYIRLGTLPGGYAMSVHKQILKEGGIFESDHVRNPNLPVDERLRKIVLDCVDGMDLLALKNTK